MALPAEVARGLVHGLRHVAEVRSHVMLEAFAADVLEKLLQLWNLRHACAAESFQRIVGESACAGVAADHAAPVVGGDSAQSSSRRA